MDVTMTVRPSSFWPITAGVGTLLLAVLLAAAGLLGSAFADEDRVEKQILPLRTIRFPGGGIDHGTADRRVLCATSGWSREDGAQIFDISEPSRLRLVGRVGARGYAVAPPVLLGGYALYPNLCSVSVVDFTQPESPRHACLLSRTTGSGVRVAGRFIVSRGGDGVRLYRLDGRAPKAPPVWIGYLPEQPLSGFPVSEREFPTVAGTGTNRLWRTYELTDSGFRLKSESSVERKPAPATPDPRLAAFPKNSRSRWVFSGPHAFRFDTSRPSISSYEVRGTNAVFLGESFFLHALGTVAAKDNTAYVYSPGARRTVLTLDVGEKGAVCRDFSSGLVGLELARTNTFMTIGMQTGGAIARNGDKLFCDDGIVEIGTDGRLVPVRDPVLAAANHSFDGHRVAIAQSRRCRVLDFSRFPEVKTVADFAPTGLVHITGCALADDRLYLTWLPKSVPNHDFIYNKPSRGYIASVALKTAKAGLVTEADSTLEIPAAVTCLMAGGRYLYAPGYNGVFTVVDAGDPANLKIIAERDDLLPGGSYKIKAAGPRVFCQTGARIVELDVSDPGHPQTARIFTRGEPGAPGYDDFTVDGGRLYALAHASLDVFDLDGEPRLSTRPAPAEDVNVVEARLPAADVGPSAPAPVDDRSATVVDPSANLVFFTVAPAGKETCGYVVAADVSRPPEPKMTSAAPCAGRPFALAVDTQSKILYAADGRSVHAFAYSTAGVLTPAGRVAVGEDFVSGPQGLAVAGGGVLVAACGTAGLFAVDVGGGTAVPLDGGTKLRRLFVADVAAEGRKLYLACDAAGFATAEFAEGGRALSRVKLTPVPAGNVTALAAHGGEIFAAAGLDILYVCREGGTPSAAVRGGRFANYFSAFGLDVVLAGDEVAAVADGEGGLLLYSAVARDARGAPAFLGELPPAKGGGPFAFGSSLAAVPGWVYLNDPGAGLRVIDISDPAHARPVACLRPAR